MMKNLTANKEELHSKQILLTFLKNKKDTILPVIIVFCLPVLLYLQTLSFGFSGFDDTDIITNNITFLNDFRNAPQTFLTDAFLVKSSPYYRPLQTLSYMADIRLSGGNNTWMYHLTNILLLGLIACLLFLLFRKFLIPLKLAILSTLVYCAHPLFISSIAWIPARGDLLLSFFSLLSFLFFIEHLQKKKVIYLFLHWFTFTIALFCKETAVFLPFLFIIYYFTFSSEKRFEKKYLLNIVLYAISGVSWFWLRSIATGNFSIQNEVKLIPLISNLQIIPESLARFFLPFDIDLFPNFSLSKTLTGLGIIIMIIVIFFNNKERTKKEKVFCCLWFLFLLLPTMLYKIKFIDYLNHRFFLPLIGILLFMLFIFPKKWFEKKDIEISWLMVAIFVFLSSITFVKSRSYSDPMTFYNFAISQNPDNALMYNNRGYVKVNIGDFQEAINDYTKAIELNPNFALFYYNRGNAYSDKSDLENAIKDYDKVIELNPDDADAYNNRGIAYSDKSDFEKAIKDYDKVIELKPDDADAYNNRGSAYDEKGDHEMAIKDYDKTIELNPNYTVAYYNRGSAYKAKGMLKEAEQDFKMYEKLKKKYATHSD
jgi:Flp pilus assembly protein TadD, contains TPR repeats